MKFWQAFIQWLVGLFGKRQAAIPAPAVEPTIVPAPEPLPPAPAPAPEAPAPAPEVSEPLPAASQPIPAATPEAPAITMAEFLMGRDQLYPLTDDLKAHAQVTVDRVNQLLAKFGSKRKVDSGYRPEAINDRTANAAKNSKHEICEACDLEDKDGKLWQWAVHNLAVLKEIGLWMEDPRWTPDWLHVQIVAPASGRRVFVPSAAPAPAPQKWTGMYDHSFDGRT